MDFKISGVKNISIGRGEQVTLPLTIYFLGGDKENVTISAIGLSSGINVTINHPTDIPDFDLTMTFDVSLNIMPTRDTINIVGITESGIKVERIMILNITDPPNHYPVITLNGNSTSDITLNDPWVDPGFTAFDVEDGDITGQVQVTGTVNNNYALAYTIRYEVTDTEGYKAIKTRTVRVNNSMQYLSGTYLCSTDIPGVGFYVWNSPASISASATKNNFLVLSRMTDCYGLALDVEINGLTLTLPPQLQHGYNTSTSSSGICADLVHYFNGSGTLANITTHPVITLNYTDMYKDSTGNTSSFFKTDVYQKQ